MARTKTSEREVATVISSAMPAQTAGGWGGEWEEKTGRKKINVIYELVCN